MQSNTMKNITGYAEYAAMSGLSQDTIDTYIGHVKRLYAFLHNHGLETDDPDGKCLITAEMLNSFTVSLYKRHLKADSRNNYASAFRGYFQYLQDLERLDKNPTAILRYQKTHFNPRTDGKPAYRTEELLRLLAVFEEGGTPLDIRNRAYVMLALATALRVSEVCDLTLADLDGIRQGHIWVRGKGGDEEEVAVASFAVQPVLDYLAVRPRVQSSALFLTQKKTPLTRKQAHGHIAVAQREAGLVTGTHIFRHTTLTRVEPYGRAMVRDIGRHACQEVTDRYTHTSLEERKQAIEEVYADFLKRAGIAA